VGHPGAAFEFGLKAAVFGAADKKKKRRPTE